MASVGVGPPSQRSAIAKKMNRVHVEFRSVLYSVGIVDADFCDSGPLRWRSRILRYRQGDWSITQHEEVVPVSQFYNPKK